MKTDDAPKPDADSLKRVGPVTIRAYVSRRSVKPGDTFQVAVALDLDNGWHLYGQNPESTFLVPSTVAMETSESLTSGDIEISAPHRAVDAILKQMVNTYTGEIWFRVPVTVRPDAKAGATELTLIVKTQACDDSRCLPPETTNLSISVKIDPNADAAPRHPEVLPAAGPTVERATRSP